MLSSRSSFWLLLAVIDVVTVYGWYLTLYKQSLGSKEVGCAIMGVASVVSVSCQVYVGKRECCSRPQDEQDETTPLQSIVILQNL
jgi:lysine/ornithine N-monooxygenase